MKFKPKYLLILLILIGAFLRFYNLNWGSPFYFHPDERNIASAVTQLVFPDQMNPHFFAYGSLPIYLIYFAGVVFNLFTSCIWANCLPHEALAKGGQLLTVGFEQAIIISRFYSALFSTLLIPLSFVIARSIAT